MGTSHSLQRAGKQRVESIRFSPGSRSQHVAGPSPTPRAQATCPVGCELPQTPGLPSVCMLSWTQQSFRFLLPRIV